MVGAIPLENPAPGGRWARRTRPLRRVAAVLTACATVGCAAAGCTAGPDRAEGSDLDGYRAALADLWDGTDSRAVAIEAEEAVARCMKEAGFEYWPEIPDLPAIADATVSAPDDQDEAWVAVNGYGISTGSTSAEPPPQPPASQNEVYSGGLAPAESQAYYEALNGVGDSATTAEVTARGAADLGAQGCMATGYESVSPSMTTPAVDEIFEELNRAIESIDDVPEVAAADAEWSECMAAAGFDRFGRPSEARASIEEQFGSLQSMVQVSESAFSLTADPDAVAEVQRREVALATADFACRRSADYAEHVTEVRVRIENDFVAAHKDELDAWILWYQEQLS